MAGRVFPSTKRGCEVACSTAEVSFDLDRSCIVQLGSFERSSRIIKLQGD